MDAGKWISVEDCLPSDTFESVLVWTGVDYEIGFCDPDGRWDIPAIGYSDAVTHWTPLPLPPEKNRP